MGTDEHSDATPSDLPAHMCVALAPGVRRLGGLHGATVLLGGSPLRLMNLRPPAGRALDGLLSGAPVGRRPRVSAMARRLLDAGLLDPRWPTTPGRHGPGEVTLVIPVRDRPEPLARLLDSLAALADVERPHRVVVVDDGSTDATAEVARLRGADVIIQPVAQGPAAARNRGLACVTTPLVAFMDSDCAPRAGWLTPLLAHFDDPRVALAAPRIVGSLAPVGRIERYEAVRSPLDLGATGGYVHPRTRLAYVPAAALVVRVDALRGVDGFDASLQVGEDVDLLWRLHGQSWRLRYEPGAQVVHQHRAQLGQFLRRRTQYGTSAAVLQHRHPGQVPPLTMSGWSAAAWAMAGLGGAPGTAAGTAVALGTAVLLPRRLEVLDRRWPVAMDLAIRGHLGAGRLIGSALWRSWLPLAAMAAVASRRARVALLAGGVLPALAEWRRLRPALDPATYTALRLADDAAYCAGVWQGCWRQRSLAALRPELRNWPGRRRANEDATDGP